jgi:uncharacterized protein
MLNSAIKLAASHVIHGQGLIATKLIPRGEVVWQLDSDEPIIHLTEVKSWPKEKLDEFEWFGFQWGEAEFVYCRGIERFMNHSCDPNTWWKGNQTLVVCRDIQPGEEVTYDYTTADILLDYQMRCHCGSKSCRGVITNKDYLHPDWQKKYGQHLPGHVLKAISKTYSPSV